LRREAPGWGYRRDQVPSVEPTALACLALIASGDRATAESDIAISAGAARWLAVVQRPDGSLPVSEAISSPGWSTPYGLLLWSALSGYRAPQSRARAWLLECKGEIGPAGAGAAKVIGHDANLVGWPWVKATHSWLEPTSLAVMALCRLGLVDHSRVK